MTWDTISLLFFSFEKEDHWGPEETNSSSQKGDPSLLNCNLKRAGSPPTSQRGVWGWSWSTWTSGFPWGGAFFLTLSTMGMHPMGRNLPLTGWCALRDRHWAVQRGGYESKRGSWVRHSVEKLGTSPHFMFASSLSGVRGCFLSIRKRRKLNFQSWARKRQKWDLLVVNNKKSSQSVTNQKRCIILNSYEARKVPGSKLCWIGHQVSPCSVSQFCSPSLLCLFLGSGLTIGWLPSVWTNVLPGWSPE